MLRGSGGSGLDLYDLQLLGCLNRGEITHEQAIVEVLRECGIEVPTSGRRRRQHRLVSGALWRSVTRTVRVLGKGSRERIVPVGRKATAALRRYLTERKAKAGETALFLARGGRRIGRRVVQGRVALWAKKAGIRQHMYPHMFRHSFATHVLESSGAIREVQELLGHTSISTTAVYTHLDFQHLAKVYMATHPRAQRRKDETP